MTFIRLAFACLANACLVAASPIAAYSQTEPAQSEPGQAELIKGVPYFDTPKYSEQQIVIYQLARAGALDRAEQRLDQMIQYFPDAPQLHIMKAQIAINRRDDEAAIGALIRASSLGHANLQKTLASPEFSTIATDGRLQALLGAKPAPIPVAPFAPGLVKKGIGLVTVGNTRWNADLARLEVVFARPPSQRSKPVSRFKDAVMERLAKMVKRGQAAGNIGDVYDNRDAGHSQLGGLKDVQLTVARYSEAAVAKGLHYGLNEGVLFDGVAFGNSSTALTGGMWRSQPRHAMTSQLRATRAWQLYDNNHLYVFPEHRDHDPVESKGRGDLFPANTPLMLISNGSSKSDKQFLKAIQIILAGLKPDVKAVLKENRLIAPTVQQILRRGMKGIETDYDYLSPAAHPTVFDQEDVDLERMLALANGMTTETIPPRAQISVTGEGRPIEPFAPLMSEELFTTPDAIARLWRGGGRSRTYTLSAAGSSDVSERPLAYVWRVISGDPAKITISPIKPDASEVEVMIDWHEGIKNPSGLTSSRVDIALFAHNGAAYSAPAMFSVDLPLHQRRVYSDDPSEQRPLSIAYLPPRGQKKAYADPVIWPGRDWNDVFDYDDNGNLLGWTRSYRKGGTARFTRHGLKVLETDAKGRPDKAEALSYQVGQGDKGRSLLMEQPLGRVFSYAYGDDVTRLGLPIEIKAE